MPENSPEYEKRKREIEREIYKLIREPDGFREWLQSKQPEESVGDLTFSMGGGEGFDPIGFYLHETKGVGPLNVGGGVPGYSGYIVGTSIVGDGIGDDWIVFNIHGVPVWIDHFTVGLKRLSNIPLANWDWSSGVDENGNEIPEAIYNAMREEPITAREALEILDSIDVSKALWVLGPHQYAKPALELISEIRAAA